jgi:hypothetical protein
MDLYDDELIGLMSEMAAAMESAVYAYKAEDEKEFDTAIGKLLVLQAKTKQKGAQI